MSNSLKKKYQNVLTRCKLLWKIISIEQRLADLENNLYAEVGDPSVKMPKVLSMEETLRKVIDKHLSIGRFGDGEFDMVTGRNMIFQTFDPLMRTRLLEVMKNPIPRFMCGVPGLVGSLAGITPIEQRFWRHQGPWIRETVLPMFSAAYHPFGDALITRPYLRYTDREMTKRVFALWKELIQGHNLLIVEGRFSRLGIGNDFFEDALSIRRIWCPHVNAFSKYAQIKKIVEDTARADDLILLALGGTATILAYDLCLSGHQTVDCGHVDIEYMWMKMGATSKVPIPGRYIAECPDSKGQDTSRFADEEAKYNVVTTIE